MQRGWSDEGTSCTGAVIRLLPRKGGLPVRAGNGHLRSIARDRSILHEGQVARDFYEVLSGTVRIFSLFSDGRRQIHDFLLPGDLLGLEIGPASSVSAEAVTDVVLRERRRSELLSAVGDTADGGFLLARCHAALIRDAHRMREHILSLGRRNAAERVASFLVVLGERQGGGTRVDLPMPRGDIADHLGLTVETVSRILTHLRRAGIVDLVPARRAVVVRDAAALRRLQAGEVDPPLAASDAFWRTIAGARSH